MEIKDINVSVERLEEVRGGTGPSISQVGLQFGGNTAVGAVSNWGVGNSAQNSVAQDASQSMTQVAALDSKNLFSVDTDITNSIIGLGFPSMARPL